MPQDNAATPTGAAEEERKPLTDAEIKALQQEGYQRRNRTVDAIEVRRDEGDDEDGTAGLTPAGDEDEERQRVLQEEEDRLAAESGTAPKSKSDVVAADQVKATSDDEGVVIDIAQAAKVRFRTKVDGKEELVSADRVLAQFQKNGAADVRLAAATAARTAAEAALAEANKRLAEADTAKQRRDAEAAVAASEENLTKIVSQATDAMYEGDKEAAAKLLTSGIKDVVAAALTSRGDVKSSANSSVDADQLAAEVEARITVNSALSKLFTDYPEIKSDPDFAFAADRARARFEAEGHPRASAIALAGESVAAKFKLGKHSNGASDAADTTTLDGKRAAKKDGTDDVPRAGSRTQGEKTSRAETTSDVISAMGASRRGVRP